MSWAEASVLFGIFALIAWVSWLRHRTSVKAMEHGYEQKRTGDVMSYEDDTCQIWNAPKGWAPHMWNSRIRPNFPSLQGVAPAPRYGKPPCTPHGQGPMTGEKPTPKESGELPQPGDK